MKNLLIVEDDEVFARVTQKAMQKRRFLVSVVNDLKSAFVFLQTGTPDIVILDLKLGDDISLPLIPQLRAANPAIKILVLTGYASIATAVEAIKLGATNYLPKPANADEMLCALEETAEIKAIEPPEKSMSVNRLEWEYIQKVLHDNDGNISATARQLNMHRRTLQRKLQKRPQKN